MYSQINEPKSNPDYQNYHLKRAEQEYCEQLLSNGINSNNKNNFFIKIF